MTLVELSHLITDGLVTYPGIPAPRIGSHLSFEDSAGHYAPGTEFQIATMTLAANTGTYLDTPAHRHRDGHDLAGLALERCADLPLIVVAGTPSTIGPEHVPEGVAGCAVLFATGWDGHWGTPEYASGAHPHLSADAAEALVDGAAALVGIDSINVDATTDGTRPAHTILLAAGVPIVEHLTGLAELPPTGARFFATPPLIGGMATFPVRAFAIVPGV